LANIALHEGDFDTAMSLLDASLAVARGRGDDWAVATVLNALGDVARRQGDYGQAKRRYQESLALHERLGSHPRATRASVLHNLGYVAVHEGDLGRAVELFSAGLRLYQRRGERRGVTECLVGLGSAAAAAARPEQAARLFGAAEACFEDLGTRLSPSNRTDYETALARTRDGIDPERFASAWRAGRRLGLEDAVGEALDAAPLSARSQPVLPPSVPPGGTTSSRSPGAPRSQPRALGRRRSGTAPMSRPSASHASSA
jgi:non-specific serine/threonine protein kinase